MYSRSSGASAAPAWHVRLRRPARRGPSRRARTRRGSHGWQRQHEPGQHDQPWDQHDQKPEPPRHGYRQSTQPIGMDQAITASRSVSPESPAAGLARVRGAGEAVPHGGDDGVYRVADRRRHPQEPAEQVPGPVSRRAMRSDAVDLTEHRPSSIRIRLRAVSRVSPCEASNKAACGDCEAPKRK